MKLHLKKVENQKLLSFANSVNKVGTQSCKFEKTDQL